MSLSCGDVFYIIILQQLRQQPIFGYDEAREPSPCTTHVPLPQKKEDQLFDWPSSYANFLLSSSFLKKLFIAWNTSAFCLRI